MYGVLFLYKNVEYLNKNKSILLHTICRYILAYKIFTISEKKKIHNSFGKKKETQQKNSNKTIAYITTTRTMKTTIRKKSKAYHKLFIINVKVTYISTAQ